VVRCSDADTAPKPAWRPRKEAYLGHLREVPPEVLRVSAADKLHNARTILADFRQIGDRVFERFKGGKGGTLWYYGALVEAFKARGAGALAEELERVILELRRLAQTT
jgi:GTP pyrophosphokinase